jgi:hypothetical protein
MRYLLVENDGIRPCVETGQTKAERPKQKDQNRKTKTERPKQKSPHECGPSKFFGSSTWARTRDLRINSPALYRLSYRGTAVQLDLHKKARLG